jgi:hypothetical protein
VAEHAARGHEIDVSNPEILAKVTNFKTRIFREALEIKKHNIYFSRDHGQRASDTWFPVLSKNANKVGKKPLLPPPSPPPIPPKHINTMRITGIELLDLKRAPAKEKKRWLRKY